MTGRMRNERFDNASTPDTTLDLFDCFGTAEAPTNPIEARFWEMHAENPRVYQLFDKFAWMLIHRGYQHHSADAVLHRIRWASAVEMEGDEFKINDHFSAYYARLWMRNNPDNRGFFRLRVLKNGEASETLTGQDVGA